MSVARVFSGSGMISDFSLNEDFLVERGVDPSSSDDTQFGTDRVYCSSHVRVHSVGWCTVSNALKLPVDDTLPTVYAV